MEYMSLPVCEGNELFQCQSIYYKYLVHLRVLIELITYLSSNINSLFRKK